MNRQNVRYGIALIVAILAATAAVMFVALQVSTQMAQFWPRFEEWMSMPGPSYFTYRIRMTLEVDVDGETKSASSVIDYQVRDKSADLSPAATITEMRGEAIFLDVGKGRNVVATMWFPYKKYIWHPGRMAAVAFGLKIGAEKQLADFRGKTADVAREELPQFLTFTDPADSGSVKLLEPTEASFRAMFGPNVRFRRLWVEVVEPGHPARTKHFTTGEPLSEKIKLQLPWVDEPGVGSWNKLNMALRKLAENLDTRHTQKAFQWSGST